MERKKLWQPLLFENLETQEIIDIVNLINFKIEPKNLINFIENYIVFDGEYSLDLKDDLIEILKKYESSIVKKKEEK